VRQVVVVHFDEIALKRGRRAYYEKRLVNGLENCCRDLGPPGIRALFDRVIVSGGKTEIPVAVLLDRFSRVFGVRYLREGWLTGTSPELLREAIDLVIASRPDARTFGVRVKGGQRSDLNRRSLDLAAELGAYVGGRTGWKVDLGSPDLWIEVLLDGAEALVSGRRVEGPGGLPIGTTGHGVALVSGGIDSPVAAWMMMGRGLRLSVLHFHSAPFTGRQSQAKVRDLALSLARYQPTIEVAMIPFAELQRALVAATPPRYRVILYRRFMLRIAEVLARAVGATCLVTGDALAQVASQTVENIGTIDAVAGLPILRPLIGMQKSSVVDLARELGTYEISIRPHEDCCAFLMPDRPATATTPAELTEVERDLPIAEWVAAAVAAREVFTTRFEDGLASSDSASA
jgi:thiamine biosynthesis protein ThiI